jgi:hypothetical protein
VIAAHGRDAARYQALAGLARPQGAGDAVAEVDDPIGGTRTDVGEHRFQRGQVSVHVGDDG